MASLQEQHEKPAAAELDAKQHQAAADHNSEAKALEAKQQPNDDPAPEAKGGDGRVLGVVWANGKGRPALKELGGLDEVFRLANLVMTAPPSAEDRPRSLGALELLANIYIRGWNGLKNGEPSAILPWPHQAVKYAERWIELSPACTDALCIKYDALVRMHEHDRGIRQHLPQPLDEASMKRLDEASMKRRELDAAEAIVSCHKMGGAVQRQADTVRLFGQLHANRQHAELVNRATAILADVNCPLDKTIIRGWRAAAYVNLGEYEQARADLRNVKSSSNGYGDWIYDTLSWMPEAERDVAMPAEVVFYRLLCDKQYQELEARTTAIISDDHQPENVKISAYTWRSAAHAHLRQYEQARADIRYVLSVSPQHIAWAKDALSFMPEAERDIGELPIPQVAQIEAYR